MNTHPSDARIPFTIIGIEKSAKSLSEKTEAQKIPMGSMLHKKPRQRDRSLTGLLVSRVFPSCTVSSSPHRDHPDPSWKPRAQYFQKQGGTPTVQTLILFLKGFCDAVTLCQVREEGNSLWFDAIRQKKLHFSLPLFLLCFLKGLKHKFRKIFFRLRRGKAQMCSFAANAPSPDC